MFGNLFSTAYEAKEPMIAPLPGEYQKKPRPFLWRIGPGCPSNPAVRQKPFSFVFKIRVSPASPSIFKHFGDPEKTHDHWHQPDPIGEGQTSIAEAWVRL